MSHAKDSALHHICFVPEAAKVPHTRTHARPSSRVIPRWAFVIVNKTLRTFD